MKTIYIVLTFCMGLLAGYLLFNPGAPNHVTRIDSPEASIVKSAQINNDKIIAEVALKKRNNLLAGQLAFAAKEISDSKSALQRERNKIKALQAQLINDTVTKAPCTPNLELAAHLDTVQAITDSLICDYEYKVMVTEEVVAVRDSQLFVCNNAYRDMQSLVNEQVARERQLSEELKTALKQQKRARVQNRILALGMLFISGITTTLIIKAKQ